MTSSRGECSSWGLMQLKDGFLLIVRGFCLSFKVSPDAGAEELLTIARDKIIRFKQNVFGTIDVVELLYPDRLGVENLPRSILCAAPAILYAAGLNLCATGPTLHAADQIYTQQT